MDMGKYSVFIVVNERLRIGRNELPYASDYSFWIPLISRYLAASDTIRIDCWIDEEYAINRVLPYARQVDQESNPYMKIFWLDKTPEVIDDIILNPFDDEPKIAWFSIFLEKDGVVFFSSSHYGLELSASDVDEVEVEFLRKSVTPDMYIHVWDSAGRNC